MAAEQNSFRRWRGSPTICSDSNAIWEMSVKGSFDMSVAVTGLYAGFLGIVFLS